MQLTGGLYKGRKINVPKGARPTLSKVRESVFNVLYSQFGDFTNLNFLDLFMGSAIMSFEAVSRGFLATGYEIDYSSYKLILQNIKDTTLDIKAYKGDCFYNYKRLKDKYNVIYADPPWDYSYKKIIEISKSLLNKDGILILEYEKKKKLEILKEISSVSDFELFIEKDYGRCCLSFLKFN